MLIQGLTAHKPPRGAAVLVPIGASLGAVGAVFAGPFATGAVAVGIVGVVVAAYAPGVLLASFLLIPFYKGAVQPYSPIDITVVLAALNALQLAPVLLDRGPRCISRVGLTMWGIVGVLVLAGVLYAPDQDLALSKALTYWALVIIPIVPAAIRVGSKPAFVRQFLWSVFGMAALAAVVGVLGLSGGQRTEVLGTNTINTALACLFVPIIGVTFVLGEAPRSLRLATLALIPIAILAALATGSRGPFVAAAALAAIGLAGRLRRPGLVSGRLAAMVAGLVVVSVVVVSVAATNLPDQSTARFFLFGELLQSGISGEMDSSLADLSTGGRIALFDFAVSLFQGSPIIGVGTAGYEALTARLLGPIGSAAYPHNSLLQIATELGLVGVAVSVGLVAVALSRRLPVGGASRALRAIFLFLLLEGMLSGDVFSDRMVWGLLALLILMEVPGSGTSAPAPETQTATT